MCNAWTSHSPVLLPGVSSIGYFARICGGRGIVQAAIDSRRRKVQLAPGTCSEAAAVVTDACAENRADRTPKGE